MSKGAVPEMDKYNNIRMHAVCMLLPEG